MNSNQARPVVVIVGSDSRSGQEAARYFAAAGADLVLHHFWRREDQARFMKRMGIVRTLGEELWRLFRTRFIFTSDCLCYEGEVEQLFAKAQVRFGRIDLLAVAISEVVPEELARLVEVALRVLGRLPEVRLLSDDQAALSSVA